MFYSIVLTTSNGSRQDLDVSEDIFCDLLKELSECAYKTIAISDDDGCYFYYFWDILHDFTYFGNSSELLKDYVDSYL